MFLVCDCGECAACVTIQDDARALIRFGTRTNLPINKQEREAMEDQRRSIHIRMMERSKYEVHRQVPSKIRITESGKCLLCCKGNAHWCPPCGHLYFCHTCAMEQVEDDICVEYGCPFCIRKYAYLRYLHL